MPIGREAYTHLVDSRQAPVRAAVVPLSRSTLGVDRNGWDSCAPPSSTPDLGDHNCLYTERIGALNDRSDWPSHSRSRAVSSPSTAWAPPTSVQLRKRWTSTSDT
jgi:hypothetical protein